MKILLTGGAGYVGSAVLRWLLKHGHDAIAYDDLSEGHRGAVPGDRLIVGDILNRAALVAALHDHGTEAMMHFAARASVSDSIQAPNDYWRINVLGTKSVLDSALEAGVRKIVFSSTAATYGFDEPMPLTEHAAQIPQVPYGTTKLAAEMIIRDYGRAYDLGHTIFRYFNASGADPCGNYGECRRSETHLIPLVLFAALGKRDTLRIYGQHHDTRDGTCVRDYVHTDDLAQAHQLAVEQLEPGQSRVFNIGSGSGTTVLEVVEACQQVVGQRIPYEIADPRPGDPAVLIASSEKLRTELGWEPQIAGIKQIVKTAWDWHRGYPNGYDQARQGT